MLLVSPLENLLTKSFVPFPSGAAPSTRILIVLSSLIKSTILLYLTPYDIIVSISIENSDIEALLFRKLQLIA